MLNQKMKELKVIYELISKVWEEEITTHEWQYGIKCPIHKKGDMMMCDSYSETHCCVQYINSGKYILCKTSTFC